MYFAIFFSRMSCRADSEAGHLLADEGHVEKEAEDECDDREADQGVLKFHLDFLCIDSASVTIRFVKEAPNFVKKSPKNKIFYLKKLMIKICKFRDKNKPKSRA
jgi:hypothetical protein